MNKHPPSRGWSQDDLTGPEEFFCQLEDLRLQAARPRRKRPPSRRALLAGTLLGLAGLTTIGAVVASTCTLCYAVISQGDAPLAYVRGQETYQQAVDQVERQVSQIIHADYAYPQDTKVALTIAPKEKLQTSEELTASLMETVPQVQEACVLTVDGIAAGACLSREEIHQALDLVRAHYATADTLSVTFASTLEITLDYLPAQAEILDPEALAARLEQPPEETEEGDAVTVMAALDAAALPETEETAAPLLVVETIEEVTYTQPIPAPTQEQEDASLLAGETQVIQQGTEGVEARTDRVTRRCGEETGRENLSSQVLTEPVPTVVSVGTATGVQGAQGRFQWPCTGQITSPFGSRYIFGSTSFHSGTDIANSMGTPIYAAAGGTVTWSGEKGSYGNLVIVDHGNGFATYYGHCSQLLVQVGEQVTQGQQIALMGSTGRSTGPHCHFEVRWQEEPIDPLQCLP